MKLTKIEVQQMLREMHIKFNVEETYEDLKTRLQKEHHNQWLKSIFTAKTQHNKSAKTILKRKKKSYLSLKYSDVDLEFQKKPNDKKSRIYKQKINLDKNKQYTWQNNIDHTPSIDIANKVEEKSTNRYEQITKIVFKRAKKRCELCNKREIQIINKKTKGLEICHITAIEEGGNNSRKNLVALCPECKKNINSEPTLKMLKKLRLKARRKIYSEIKVTKKTRNDI